MAAFDLPVNNPDLYYLSARQLDRPHPSRAGMTLSPVSPAGGPTTSSSAATASHPDLSTTSPRNRTATSTIASTLKGTPANTSTSAANESIAATINAPYAGSTSAAALASLGTNASPTDVVLTLPPPLLRLLVVASPFISFLTTISQLLTWTHPNPFAPFFLPAIWAIACLGGEVILRYGLSGLILGFLAIGWLKKKGTERRRKAEIALAQSAKDGAGASNKNILATVAAATRDSSSVRTISVATSTSPAVQVLTPAALNTHLAEAAVLAKHIQVLHRSFSPVLAPFTWKDSNLSWNAVYLLLNSYPLYFLLTYAIPVRYIILTTGLIALFWQAPWFAVVRNSLWKSALVRRTVRVGTRVLYGEINLVRQEAMRGQKNVGITTRWTAFKQIWRDTKLESNADKRRRASSPGTAAPRGRTPSVSSNKPLNAYETNIVEIHYLFSIFENQRWWIGLEWTQALLPNERPSWSDPTHAPSAPPGSFALPPPMTIYISATKKRTFTWKWSDPEWRIRGTAGVLISPSTIGANPNPVNAAGSNSGVASGTAAATAASMSDKATKDFKDVMGSLGDWKSMLANRRDPTEEKDRRMSTASGDEKPVISGSSHVRKGSASLFGDGLNALIGAKDGKPFLKDQLVSAAHADVKASEAGDAQTAGAGSSTVSPTEDPDLLGHPARLDANALADDQEAKQWEVDAQGWVYADNHWEKPTSKGGMGRYTRRRAWVRRAIVVEQLEAIDTSNEAELQRLQTSLGHT